MKQKRIVHRALKGGRKRRESIPAREMEIKRKREDIGEYNTYICIYILYRVW